MTDKLYRVTCKGMTSGLGCSVTYGIAYVVANDPSSAYKKVRDALDKGDLGFSKDREMDKIELLAEATDCPNCGYILHT